MGGGIVPLVKQFTIHQIDTKKKRNYTDIKWAFCKEKNGLYVNNQQTKPGFGSNVVNIETTIIYTPESRVSEVKQGFEQSRFFPFPLVNLKRIKRKREMVLLSASTKDLLSNSVYFHHQNRSFSPLYQKPTQLSFSSSSSIGQSFLFNPITSYNSCERC